MESKFLEHLARTRTAAGNLRLRLVDGQRLLPVAGRVLGDQELATSPFTWHNSKQSPTLTNTCVSETPLELMMAC